MSTAVIGAGGLEMSQLDVGALVLGTVTSETSTTYVDNYFGQISTFSGTGFTYDSFGYPTGGVVTSLQETFQGQVVYQVAGFAIPVLDWTAWANNDDTLGAMQRVFGGNDTLTGSLGADTLAAFSGNDSLSGGAGNDMLNGGPSLDANGTGNDTISGGTGNDTLGSSGGTNFLRGDDGNDSIIGGSGFDDINGNKGDDTIVGGPGDDWLVGGQGNDLITSTGGGDILLGNLGNDTLNGGAGNEIIRGGQANDLLSGGAGNDWLSGDRGNDTITGGAGTDTFHSFSGAGLDLVTDFHIAEGDRVLLDPDTTYTVSQVGADVVINMGNGDQMTLQNVQMSTLTSGWISEGWS